MIILFWILFFGVIILLLLPHLPASHFLISAL